MSEGDAFDGYAADRDYREAIEQSIAFAHAGHEMFVRAKAEVLLRVAHARLADPRTARALDVGCGIGSMHDHIAPSVGEYVGVDTSAASVRRAAGEHPESEFVAYGGDRIPFGDGAFDLCFAVNVMHHVEPADRARFAAELVRVTADGGLTVVFEHNPWNPLTRLAVARCEFDDGVVLVSRPELAGLLEEAGAGPVERSYILFIPLDRRWARTVERRLAWLPLGAQHMVAVSPR